MGTPLFTLEDEFIESVCFGMSRSDTAEIFIDAVEAGREKLLEALMRKVESNADLAPYADGFDVDIDEDGHYVLVVPEEIEDAVIEREFGSLDTPPSPLLRSVVQQHSYDAARAITQALEMS